MKLPYPTGPFEAPASTIDVPAPDGVATTTLRANVYSSNLHSVIVLINYVNTMVFQVDFETADKTGVKSVTQLNDADFEHVSQYEKDVELYAVDVMKNLKEMSFEPVAREFKFVGRTSAMTFTLPLPGDDDDDTDDGKHGKRYRQAPGDVPSTDNMTPCTDSPYTTYNVLPETYQQDGRSQDLYSGSPFPITLEVQRFPKALVVYLNAVATTQVDIDFSPANGQVHDVRIGSPQRHDAQAPPDRLVAESKVKNIVGNAQLVDLGTSGKIQFITDEGKTKITFHAIHSSTNKVCQSASPEDF